MEIRSDNLVFELDGRFLIIISYRFLLNATIYNFKMTREQVENQEKTYFSVIFTALFSYKIVLYVCDSFKMFIHEIVTRHLMYLDTKPLKSLL